MDTGLVGQHQRQQHAAEQHQREAQHARRAAGSGWPQCAVARAWSRSARTCAWLRFTPSYWRSTKAWQGPGRPLSSASREFFRYILTNHHVVEAASEIQIALVDGRNAKAKIIGSDPESDLAVLKIDLENLPSITIGNSESAKIGDIVLAFGNPFAVGQTVTMGIIGAKGRSQVGINTFENFIQTDAAINPGNSGGALTDTAGNLIGINTAIWSRTGGSLGIGFAIPVSAAIQIMKQIIETGSVTRGWLGVSMHDVTPELVESLKLKKLGGILITGVLKDGPADQAGIKPGDILQAVDGDEISNSAEVLNLVAALPPGRTVLLTIIRSQSEKSFKVTVGKRPPS